MGKHCFDSTSSVFEQLEPRILLSGSPLPETDDSAIHVDAELCQETEINSITEILFVDPSVADIDSLFENFDRNVEVVLLPTDGDGLEYITSILKDREGISAVHIFSHGDKGQITLGNAVLDESTLDQYRDSLQSWSGSLTCDADILIYGCNFGQSDGLLQEISSLTSADIAASDDLTGSEHLGGDAELEVEIGEIETEELFSQAKLNSANVVLRQVGPGQDLASASNADDPGGDRLNVDLSNVKSLDAGTYNVRNFQLNVINESAGGGSGTITPVLLTGTPGSYTVLWIGDAFDPSANGQQTAATYTLGDETFTLGTTSDVYAGFFTQNSGADIIAYANSGLTDHDNAFTAPTMAGDTVDNFSHTSLARSYAFEINVTATGDVLSNDDDYTVSNPINEDTVLNVSAYEGVLANDDDIGSSIIGYTATSAMGASVTVNADGSFTYDPTSSSTLQALDEGEIVTDTFEYTLGEDATAPDGLMNVQYIHTSGSNPGNDSDNWQALWDEVAGTNTTGNVVTGTGTYNVVYNNSDTETVFDYNSGGDYSVNRNINSINSDGPGGGAASTNGDNYSIRTNTFLKFQTAGTYTIALGSDDGRRIELKEASGGSAPGYTGFTARGDQFNGSFTSGDTVIGYSGGTGHQQTTGTFTVNAGDILELTAFYYEAGGGDSGEISIANGTHSFFNTGDFSLLQSGLNGILLASDFAQLNQAIVSETSTVSIEVTGVNDAPVATNDSNSITELVDDTVTVNSVSGSFITDGTDDSDADDSSATFSITQVSNTTSGTDTSGTIAGAYGTLTWTVDTQGNGSYTYTLDDANADVQALTAGTKLFENFTYTLSDNHPDGNVKTDTANLTITINGANDSLLAEHNSADVTEDGGASQIASGNLITDDDSIDTNHADGITVDVDYDGVDLDIISVQNSASGTDTSGTIVGDYGTLTWNAETGAYTYTLNNGTDGVSSVVQNLTAGQQLTDTFTYKLHNGFVSGDGLMNVQYIHTSGANPGNTTSNWKALWDEVGETNTTGNVVTVAGTYNVVYNHSDTETVFDYEGGGNFGTNRNLNTINSDGPGGGASSVGGDDYSIRAKSYLAFNVGGTYTIALGSDDGRRIQLTEASVGSAPGFSGFTSRGDQYNGSFTSGDNVIGFSGGTGHNQTVGVFTVQAGDILELDAFYYQGNGGHSGEISIASGAFSSFTNTSDFKLLTDQQFGIALSSDNNFSLAAEGWSETETDTATLTVTINGTNDVPVITTKSTNTISNLNAWSFDHNQPTGVNTQNPSWNVSGTTVTQTANSHPSVLYSDFDINTDQYKGEFTVKSTSGSDDDFFGFVLGYDPGGVTTDADGFILIDWNRQAENHSQMGQSNTGLAASFVQGTNMEGTDFWTHTGDVTEVARATNLGSTGFTLGTEYTIRYEIDGTSLKVYVDDVLELNLTAADFGLGAIPQGKFGFYNFAQENTVYEYINLEQYTENASGLPISPDFVVNDIDSANFDGGTFTVEVTNNGVSTEDVLSSGVYNYSAFATLDGASTNSKLIFNLNATATTTEVQALARAITYANSSDNPDTSTRTVRFTVNDGDGGSTNTDLQVYIEAVNDAPTINVVNDVVSINEDVTTAIGGITIADVDANSGDLQLTLSVVSGTLSITDPNAGLKTGTSVVITGTVAELNTALSALTYLSALDFSGSVKLSISVDDQGNTGTGSALTASNSLTIQVDPVIDVSVPDVATIEDQAVDVTVSVTDSSENLSEITFTNVDGTITGNGITDLGGGSYRWTSSGTQPSEVDFSAITVNSHGSQDIDKSYSVSSDGKTLNLTDNTWRNIDFNYTVTANTILEFEFKSNVAPELSMITFDTNSEWSTATPYIKVFGVQNPFMDSVNNDYTNYDGSGNWVKYKIPVGDYFTGAFTKLAFVNDDDRTGSPGDSSFRNVVVYENNPDSSLTFSYTPSQDLEFDTQFDVEVKTFNSGDLNTHNQQVDVAITKVNDNPFITKVGGDTDSAAFTETDAVNLTATGTLTANDVDLNDTVTYSVRSVSATGITAGLTSSYSSLLAMMSTSGSVDNMSYNDKLNWSFDSGNEAFNYLAPGEVLTLTYTLQATDDSGISSSFDTHDVTINITGTNDRPIALNRAVSISEDAKLQVQNLFIRANELDFSQDLDAENISVEMNGPMDEEFIYQLDLQAGTLTFDPHQFNYLKEGEVLSFKFTYTIRDNSGFGAAAPPNEVDNIQETFTLFIVGNMESPPAVVAVQSPQITKQFQTFVEFSKEQTDGSSLRSAFTSSEVEHNSLTFVAGNSRLHFQEIPLSEMPLNIVPPIFNENLEPSPDEVAEPNNSDRNIKDKTVFDLPKISESELKMIEDLRVEEIRDTDEENQDSDEEDELSYHVEDEISEEMMVEEKPRYRPVTQYDLDLEVNLNETLVGDFDSFKS